MKLELEKYKQIVQDICDAYYIDGDEMDRDIGVGKVLQKWRLEPK